MDNPNLGTLYSKNEMDHAKKANKDLTPEERKAKRELKDALRFEQKRQKLETRLRHARVRQDTVVEQQTQEALHQIAVSMDGSKVDVSGIPTALYDNSVARTFVMKLAQELQRKQKPSKHHSHDRNNKQMQIEEARTLLKHMTKGTQKKAMFDNEDALWGYTRHKFIERAMLVCDSLSKIQQLDDPSIKECLWKTLLNVTNVCSIGCGPGNDALGVLAFLQTHRNEEAEADNTCHLHCLDYVIREWQAILNPLQEILLENKYVNTMQFEFCDVTESLLVETNDRAKQLLVSHRAGAMLFLISYLLTETRGKWEPFLRELIRLAQPGALFYFAEPTPWQLHVVTKIEDLQVVWLDSSMNQPKVQVMDRRFGPAVLMGQKKA